VRSHKPTVYIKISTPGASHPLSTALSSHASSNSYCNSNEVTYPPPERPQPRSSGPRSSSHHHSQLPPNLTPACTPANQLQPSPIYHHHRQTHCASHPSAHPNNHPIHDPRHLRNNHHDARPLPHRNLTLRLPGLDNSLIHNPPQRHDNLRYRLHPDRTPLHELAAARDAHMVDEAAPPDDGHRADARQRRQRPAEHGPTRPPARAARLAQRLLALYAAVLLRAPWSYRDARAGYPAGGVVRDAVPRRLCRDELSYWGCRAYA
jgi:hypothetical protein